MTEQPRRRNWLWVYGVLGILALLAICIPLFVIRPMFGLEAVTAQQLTIARQLWEKHGPRDYDLEYRKQGSVEGTFDVKVRNGRAISVVMDGQALDPGQYQYYTVPVMFDELERFLELANQAKGGDTLLVARFNPADGHVMRYVYRHTTGGTPRQIEVSVKLRPARDDS